MRPLYSELPEIARQETRNFIFSGHESIPDGTYTLDEYYCDELDCDCRKVLIMVMFDAPQPVPVAVFSYGWETLEYYKRASKVPEDVIIAWQMECI